MRSDTDTSGSRSSRSYAELRDDVGEGLARVCRIYGFNPLLGRLYGALLMTPEPISLAELAGAIGAAKSTTSVAARKLDELGLLKRSTRPGDRRDFYEAATDPIGVLAFWLTRYILPELEEARAIGATIDEGLARPDGDGWPPPDGLDELRRRARSFQSVVDASAALLGGLLGPTGQPDQVALTAAFESVGAWAVALGREGAAPASEA